MHTSAYDLKPQQLHPHFLDSTQTRKPEQCITPQLGIINVAPHPPHLPYTHLKI